MLLTSACCVADAGKEEVERTKKMGRDALKAILGDGFEERYIDANALEEWNDLAAVSSSFNLP